MYFVRVGFVVPGKHMYPQAELSEIRDYHTHLFKIEITLPVMHADRDIEFIKFKRDVLREMKKVWKWTSQFDFGTMSCEAIAYQLAKIAARLAKRIPLQVYVEEWDERCGGGVSLV